MRVIFVIAALLISFWSVGQKISIQQIDTLVKNSFSKVDNYLVKTDWKYKGVDTLQLQGHRPLVVSRWDWANPAKAWDAWVLSCAKNDSNNIYYIETYFFDRSVYTTTYDYLNKNYGDAEISTTNEFISRLYKKGGMQVKLSEYTERSSKGYTMYSITASINENLL